MRNALTKRNVWLFFFLFRILGPDGKPMLCIDGPHRSDFRAVKALTQVAWCSFSVRTLIPLVARCIFRFACSVLPPSMCPSTVLRWSSAPVLVRRPCPPHSSLLCSIVGSISSDSASQTMRISCGCAHTEISMRSDGSFGPSRKHRSEQQQKQGEGKGRGRATIATVAHFVRMFDPFARVVG
jgi:hypothetical protein